MTPPLGLMPTPGRNPFEIVLILVALLAGVMSLIVPGAGSRIIHEVLPNYEMIWNVCLVIGAGTSAVALALRQPLTVLVERVGMIWLAALFVPYGVAIVLLGGPLATTGGLLIFGYGLACASRVWQITHHRHLLRRAAESARAER